MKFTTIVLSIFAAAAAAVQAAPSGPIERRGVPTRLVPAFGVRRGANPDGHGNCAGLNGKLIPCSCPPDRQAFINSLNANVAAGHMVHNPSIAAPFPTGSSKADKQARISTLLATLQNLHGPGVGCPAVATVYGEIQQRVNALP